MFGMKRESQSLIWRVFWNIVVTSLGSYLRKQEDETQLALRKRLQEDEDVDILGGIEEGDFPSPYAG